MGHDVGADTRGDEGDTDLKSNWRRNETSPSMDHMCDCFAPGARDVWGGRAMIIFGVLAFLILRYHFQRVTCLKPVSGPSATRSTPPITVRKVCLRGAVKNTRNVFAFSVANNSPISTCDPLIAFSSCFLENALASKSDKLGPDPTPFDFPKPLAPTRCNQSWSAVDPNAA